MPIGLRFVCRIPVSLLAAVLALLILLLPGQLHASTYTYALTLTDSTNPTYSGTGLVTLTVPGALATYTPYGVLNGVTALSFVVDGQSFNLNDAGVNKNNVVVEFSQLTPTAAIYDITFADTVGTTPNRLELASTGGYVFYYDNLQLAAYGTFSAATLVPNAATPEPGSLLLLATGLMAGAAPVVRRIRAHTSGGDRRPVA